MRVEKQASYLLWSCGLNPDVGGPEGMLICKQHSWSCVIILSALPWSCGQSSMLVLLTENAECATYM